MQQAGCPATPPAFTGPTFGSESSRSAVTLNGIPKPIRPVVALELSATGLPLPHRLKRLWSLFRE